MSSGLDFLDLIAHQSERFIAGGFKLPFRSCEFRWASVIPAEYFLAFKNGSAIETPTSSSLTARRFVASAAL